MSDCRRPRCTGPRGARACAFTHFAEPRKQQDDQRPTLLEAALARLDREAEPKPDLPAIKWRKAQPGRVKRDFPAHRRVSTGSSTRAGLGEHGEVRRRGCGERR